MGEGGRSADVAEEPSFKDDVDAEGDGVADDIAAICTLVKLVNGQACEA